MNGIVLVTKNSGWRWAKSVTCFTKLDDHTELNFFFFVFMLSDILKIADDLLDCKDACLKYDITVSVLTPLNIQILLSYFALLLLWTRTCK